MIIFVNKDPLSYGGSSVAPPLVEIKTLTDENRENKVEIGCIFCKYFWWNQQKGSGGMLIFFFFLSSPDLKSGIANLKINMRCFCVSERGGRRAGAESGTEGRRPHHPRERRNGPRSGPHWSGGAPAEGNQTRLCWSVVSDVFTA